MQTQERRACDRRCILCFPDPVCLVCQDEDSRARILPGCPHGHAVCVDCMSAFTKHHMDNGNALPPPCPCGRGIIDMQSDLDSVSFSRHLEHFNDLQREARRPPLLSLLRGGGFLDALQDESHALRCPSCGWRFIDFDGCAAISCSCGVSFCALCFECFPTAEEAHFHLRDECPVNPYENSFFVPIHVCQRVWARRARLRASILCRQIARRDGIVLAVFIRLFLAWRTILLSFDPFRLWDALKKMPMVTRGMWRVVGAEE